MDKVKAWLKRWYWILILVAAVIVGFLVRGLFPRRGGTGTESEPPDFVERAKTRRDEVECEYMEKKAQARAEGEEQRRQLEEIARVKNVRKRRRRLADWLQLHL